ncbi:MAG: PD-(D/E)XK nuclease family protein, partial [Bdellovibrionales bacterium]|nr:PD-(D/E)XK nuclease family protein [Oligoflexia bacterium]
DGAHFLFDEILKGSDLETQAIVIEDRPEVRRTLKRVAEERGLLLQDPRDPTLLIQSEEVKSALLELEMVARNFPSPLVLPWVSTFLPNAALLRKKIIESGATQGLQSYLKISEVHEALNLLKLQYPARIALPRLMEALEASMRKAALSGWVSLALNRIFTTWVTSLRQLGSEHRLKPLRYWLEELQDKIKTSPPLVTPQKNARGLKLFRVDQGISMDLHSPELKIHFFGVSAGFFDPREQTSEWFSARDVEVLAHEFQIHGRDENTRQARESFLSWAAQSKRPAQFWEYRYNEEGSETEAMTLILNSFENLAVHETQTHPVHPKVLPSLGPKLKVATPPGQLSFTRTEFPMSFLSSLGNCAFTAYAQHLLVLYDERDPDFDLSGDSFGNLVHAAVEYLVSHQLKVTPLQAFDFAWASTQKIAWLKSDRLFKALKHKTLAVLESFLVSERDYRLRSGAEVISQEMNVKLHREGLVFSGRVDRIDQHADGVVLLDYKTSGKLPNAKHTLERNQGLQLPAYALALKETMNQEVVSAHYVHLTPLKTNRNVGFLFSKWNKGKAADKVEFPLSTARSNSASLVSQDPEAVWMEMDRKMISLLKLAKAGVFKADPADPADCVRCRYLIICGKKRDGSPVVDEESS